MFRLVTVFALVSCAFAGTLSTFDGRISNGTATTIQQHPYQVSLLKNNGSHYCGGSIISHDTIVTAAHCLYKFEPSNIKIRLGSTEYNSGGELVGIRAFRIHEGFNDTTFFNDIAVIKLSQSVHQSNKIRHIRLAKETPITGTPAVVTGWGSTSEGGNATVILQEVEVDIVDQIECASSKYNYGSDIMPSMVCAYAINKDSCQGDSGGPLVSGSKLVGVVSWGFGCAEEGYPGVYSDVAYLHEWVIATAQSL